MKYLILSCLISFGALASGKNLKMKVIPLNSPVSEATIIFKLEPPKGMAFNDVNARIKNKAKPPFRERIKDYPIERTGDQILLKLPTRDYPVDKYEILVYTKNDNRKIWEFWKKAPPLAFGSAKFEVKTSGQIIVDGDPQPPHPGEAGMETLFGIDSDNDGVRDDVEIWINENHSSSDTRGLLKKMTAVESQMMISRDDKIILRKLFDELQLVVICMSSKDKFQTQQETMNKLDAELNNTPERIKASLKAEATLSGADLSDEIKLIFKSNDYNQACELLKD